MADEGVETNSVSNSDGRLVEQVQASLTQSSQRNNGRNISYSRNAGSAIDAETAAWESFASDGFTGVGATQAAPDRWKAPPPDETYGPSSSSSSVNGGTYGGNSYVADAAGAGNAGSNAGAVGSSSQPAAWQQQPPPGADWGDPDPLGEWGDYGWGRRQQGKPGPAAAAAGGEALGDPAAGSPMEGWAPGRQPGQSSSSSRSDSSGGGGRSSGGGGGFGDSSWQGAGGGSGGAWAGAGGGAWAGDGVGSGGAAGSGAGAAPFYAAAPNGSAGGGAGPVPASDIVTISPRDAEALLPVTPSPQQARYYRPRSAPEQVVQLLGSLGASVALSKSAILAGPALLYPVWGPWVRAGFKNMDLALKPFKRVGLWRAQVLGVDILHVPYAYARSDVADTIVITLGDPWPGGARAQLAFAFAQGCEDIVVGEPAELLVLGQDDLFARFKVVRELYLPQSGVWLAEYPFVQRDAFLDLSLAIESSRVAAAAAPSGGGVVVEVEPGGGLDGSYGWQAAASPPSGYGGWPGGGGGGGRGVDGGPPAAAPGSGGQR